MRSIPFHSTNIPIQRNPTAPTRAPLSFEPRGEKPRAGLDWCPLLGGLRAVIAKILIWITRFIVNTGSVPLKLYTLYAPPNHRDGVVHHTRADAEADSEHFDGRTSE